MKDRLVIAVCCFKGDHYRWFDLPTPMPKREAEQWALDTIGMPAENYRFSRKESEPSDG